MTTSEEIDFTKEDQGKFRHPEEVAGVPYEELEQRVFAAIDACFRTLPRLKEHAGIERRLDITAVITGMEMDEKIRRCENGTFTAFFRFEQMPQRFWNTGDGRIEAEFIADFRPSSRLKDNAGEDFGRTFSEKGDKNHRGRVAIIITAEQIFEAACKHPQTIDIAREVGYSNVNNLYQRFKKEPDLKAAYDRGRQEFAKTQAEKRPPITEPVAHATGLRNPNTDNEHIFPKKPGSFVIDIDPQKLEDLIAEHGTQKLAAKELQIGYSTLFTKIEQSPFLKDAAERGRERYAEKKRSTMTVEQEGRAKSMMSQAEARNLIISASAFRDYAAAGKSLNELAKDYGVARATVYNRVQIPENQAAWNEGVRNYKAAQHGTKPVEVNLKMSRGAPIVLDKTVVYQAARTEPNLIAVARKAGNCGQAAFSRAIARDAELRQAYELGRAEYKLHEGKPAAKTPEFEGPIERFPDGPVRDRLDDRLNETAETQQTPSNDYRSSIVMELEPERAQRSVEIAPAQTPATNPSILTLSNGSQLAVGFNGNFFGLSKAEREMMNGIADLLSPEVNHG